MIKLLSSSEEVEYADLLVLKPISYSRNNKKFPLRIRTSSDIDTNINRIVILTGNTGINYGTYSYSNYSYSKYLDVVYTRDSWEYYIITFINSSFQRILKVSKLVPRNYKFVSNVKPGERITLKLDTNFNIFDTLNKISNSSMVCGW